MLEIEEERKFLLNRIEELMARKKMTIYRLSRESLIPEPTIRRWFSEKSAPTFSTLIQLCNGLGVSLSELFARGEWREVSEEHKAILEQWTSLTKEDKEIVLKLLQSLNSKQF